MAADGAFFNRPKSVSRSARVVHFNSAAYTQGLTYQEIGEIRNTSGLTVRNAVSGIQSLVIGCEDFLMTWELAGLAEGADGWILPCQE